MRNHTQLLILIIPFLLLWHGCRFPEVAPATVAEFVVIDGLEHQVGEEVFFTNNSENIDESDFRWVFGDGEVDLARDSTTNTNQPFHGSHVYTQPNVYEVELRAYNKDQYEDVKKIAITILGDGPMANCIVSPDSCHFQDCTIQFTDDSRNHDPANNQWDFGDGNTSELANPTHTYDTPGMYTVQLIVENSSGEKDTSTCEVSVYASDPAVADFAIVNDSCLVPCEVTFENQSVNGVRYEWSIEYAGGTRDTNTTDVQASVSQLYMQQGRYEVSLQAFNADDIPASITKTVTIEGIAPPSCTTVADLREKDGVSSCTVDCTVHFEHFSQCLDSLKMVYGDGTEWAGKSSEWKDNDFPAIHTYTSPGTYDATLTAFWTENGITYDSSSVVTIEVNPAAPSPTASFTIQNNQCEAPCQVSLTNTSQNYTGCIWDFGSVGSSTECNPGPRNFTVPGSYPVQLCVYNTAGDTSCFSDTIIILSSPMVDTTCEVAINMPGYQTIRGISVDPNGGYMMVGSKNEGGNLVGWLMKLNEQCDTVWSIAYSRGVDAVLTSVYPGQGGGFILGGYYNNATNKRRGWVLRTSNTGNQMWRVDVDPQQWDRLQDVVPNPKGGYVGVGRTQSCSNCLKEGLFVEVTDGGVSSTPIQIGNQSGKPFYEGFFNAAYVDDNGIAYLAGHAKDSSNHEWQAWVVKYNTQTDIIELDTMIGNPTRGEDLWDVIENGNGNLVFTGRQNDDYIWLFEMTPGGQVVNTSIINSIDNSNSYHIINHPNPAANAEYLLTGYVEETGLGRQVLLVEVNQGLNNFTVLEKYGDPVKAGDDTGYGVIPRTDMSGGYFIGGYTISKSTDGNRDAYYIFTDDQGKVN
ncbi:MAG: PKD domain-containing protein [Bacteroidota bacterium]